MSDTSIQTTPAALLSHLPSKITFKTVVVGFLGLALLIPLCLFFLILLALSEHLWFPLAFLVSAAAIVVQTGAYVRAATRDWRPRCMSP